MLKLTDDNIDPIHQHQQAYREPNWYLFLETGSQRFNALVCRSLAAATAALWCAVTVRRRLDSEAIV